MREEYDSISGKVVVFTDGATSWSNNDCATRKFSYAKLPEENGGKVMDLEQKSIERIKMASEMSLHHYGKPLVCTYSVGVIKHIRRWNYWRKNNSNGRFYKILVLLGIVKYPTMVTVLLPEERN